MKADGCWKAAPLAAPAPLDHARCTPGEDSEGCRWLSPARNRAEESKEKQSKVEHIPTSQHMRAPQTAAAVSPLCTRWSCDLTKPKPPLCSVLAAQPHSSDLTASSLEGV